MNRQTAWKVERCQACNAYIDPMTGACRCSA